MSDSPAAPAPVPAGWYPDPAGGPGRRWWNGTAWTERIEQPYSASSVSPTLGAPAGTAPYTPWIWIVALLPLASVLAILLIDVDAIIAQAIASSAGEVLVLPAASPGEVLSNVIGFLVWGLSILFAYLDWRELKKRQVDKPFHFAWAILSSLVYVIGRSIVVNRRVGTGLAPLWVAIAVALLGVVIAGVFIAQVTAALIAELPALAP